MTIQWSEYQQGIFNAVRETQDSLIIEAVAGSGKTTTLVELINQIRYGDRVIFVAFNKKIADELKARVDARKAQCRTLHSVGNAAWQKHIGFDGPAEIDGRKMSKIFEEIVPEYPTRMKYPHMPKLVSLAKGAGIVPSTVSPELECFHGLAQDSVPVWKQIIDQYEIEGFTVETRRYSDDLKRWLEVGEIDPDAIDLARKLLVRSIETSKRVIDFDDQLYMPVVTGAAFEKFDVVMLDEAQDVNSIQCEIVERLVAPGGRVIAVGDKHQAIYGFRGAHSDAMDRIAERFRCEHLPLSVCYRCPTSVVRKAQQYVPHIESAPEAPEGLVQHESFWDMREFQMSDVILCRLNAPLAALAFSLIRQRIACRIEGRDIATGLVSLVKRMKAATVEELIENLALFLKREAIRHKDDPAALARSQDKVDTINVFIGELSGKDQVQALIDNITRMFVDTQGLGQPILTLSTVHKAKGREWDRVFILNATGPEGLMPLPWAKGWQLDQEYNLIYVAVTRAKKELRFIEMDRIGIPAEVGQ